MRPGRKALYLSPSSVEIKTEMNHMGTSRACLYAVHGHYFDLAEWDRVVSAVTLLRAAFICFPKRADRPWDPPSFMFNEYQGFLQRG
jgi:hypothetical protein